MLFFVANIPPVLLMSGTSRITIKIFKVEKIRKKGKEYPNGKSVLKRLAGSSSHRVCFWENIPSWLGMSDTRQNN